MQHVHFNIIPFNTVVDNGNFVFYGKKQKRFALVYLEELMVRVHQFSRMYWKSISQKNLAVATKHPEMVAEIFPHFEHNHLHEFGKENLWFL